MRKPGRVLFSPKAIRVITFPVSFSAERRAGLRYKIRKSATSAVDDMAFIHANAKDATTRRHVEREVERLAMAVRSAGGPPAVWPTRGRMPGRLPGRRRQAGNRSTYRLSGKLGALPRQLMPGPDPRNPRRIPRPESRGGRIRAGIPARASGRPSGRRLQDGAGAISCQPAAKAVQAPSDALRRRLHRQQTAAPRRPSAFLWIGRGGRWHVAVTRIKAAVCTAFSVRRIPAMPLRLTVLASPRDLTNV